MKFNKTESFQSEKIYNLSQYLVSQHFNKIAKLMLSLFVKHNCFMGWMWGFCPPPLSSPSQQVYYLHVVCKSDCIQFCFRVCLGILSGKITNVSNAHICISPLFDQIFAF